MKGVRNFWYSEQGLRQLGPQPTSFVHSGVSQFLYYQAVVTAAWPWHNKPACLVPRRFGETKNSPTDLVTWLILPLFLSLSLSPSLFFLLENVLIRALMHACVHACIHTIMLYECMYESFVKTTPHINIPNLLAYSGEEKHSTVVLT